MVHKPVPWLYRLAMLAPAQLAAQRSTFGRSLSIAMRSVISPHRYTGLVDDSDGIAWHLFF